MKVIYHATVTNQFAPREGVPDPWVISEASLAQYSGETALERFARECAERAS
jgi:hypothetical protein